MQKIGGKAIALIILYLLLADCYSFYKMFSKILILCGIVLTLSFSPTLQSSFPPTKITLDFADDTECLQVSHDSIRDMIE